MAEPLIIALPKGRILREALPVLARAGIVPEAAFTDEDSRALKFSTNINGVSLIRVRAFDVATFVAFVAAQLVISPKSTRRSICGSANAACRSPNPPSRLPMTIRGRGAGFASRPNIRT